MAQTYLRRESVSMEGLLESPNADVRRGLASALRSVQAFWERDPQISPGAFLWVPTVDDISPACF